MKAVLLDAGPVVALFRSDDPLHGWARETLGTLAPPFFTCEPVLAEATYLLRKVPGAALGVMDLVARGIFQVTFRLDAEILALQTLMTRYGSVPMSLADACLVRMSELDPKAVVVTVDRHFRVYRRSGRLAIPVIMPG